MVTGYKFTGGTAQRIVDAVRTVERMPRDERDTRRGRTPPLGRGVQMVRVTGLVDDDGFYPGLLQEWDGLTGLADGWTDVGDVWLFGANGETLSFRRYGALCMGEREEDSLPVFSTWCCEEPGGDDDAGGGSGPSGSGVGGCAHPCVGCTNGNAPDQFVFTGSDFHNNVPALWGTEFNGRTFTLLRSGAGCLWRVTAGPAQLEWRPNLSKWVLDLFDQNSGQTASYVAIFTDCCSPQTFTRMGNDTSTPATITLTPSGGCCGEGSGGGGGGSVSVPCSPNAIPATLKVTYSTGEVFPIVYDAGIQSWVGNTAAYPTPCSPAHTGRSLQLRCVHGIGPDHWTVGDVASCCGAAVATAVPTTTSPFLLHFSGAEASGGAGTCPATVDFTVSEY